MEIGPHTAVLSTQFPEELGLCDLMGRAACTGTGMAGVPGPDDQAKNKVLISQQGFVG